MTATARSLILVTRTGAVGTAGDVCGGRSRAGCKQPETLAQPVPHLPFWGVAAYSLNVIRLPV